jgi:hypothetical protein
MHFRASGSIIIILFFITSKSITLLTRGSISKSSICLILTPILLIIYFLIIHFVSKEQILRRLDVESDTLNNKIISLISVPLIFLLSFIYFIQ